MLPIKVSNCLDKHREIMLNENSNLHLSKTKRLKSEDLNADENIYEIYSR